eukprot:TRINITY_DN59915_c0_g1_i1.p2 TRINITY_DN59915_c0_g1~~TRINITY_DN59915_c0_g1_i1.p2  ORF type:complete len:154 (-),score=30.30 TRINITY_DN59915_c0_g1_i1:985-1446(-)
MAPTVDSIAGAAVQLSNAVGAALAKIKESAEDSSTKVKLLGPVIEEQRRILNDHGISSFGEFEKLIETSMCEKSVSSALVSATDQLRAAENQWRQVLADLEANANRETRPALSLGDKAPNFQLSSTGGKLISMADVLAGRPSGILLVWLRHFG